MPPTKSKTTIYDVADLANVAISTVSRVINDSPDVSDKTRTRVREAIETLNFRPDRVARMLAQPSDKIMAIAIPSFTTPFHNELLKGVRTRLAQEDIDLMLCDLGSGDRRQVLINFLRRGAVDGLLLVGVSLDPGITQELKTLQAPVVLVGRTSDQYDSYAWDNQAGARTAVRHLIRQGHTRIGMIRVQSRPIDLDLRYKGYREALKEAGVPLDETIVASGETEKHRGYSEETGYEAMQQLLEVDPPVTAVFASSDVQALGAWKAILDAGKKVPDDIALVGYDNVKSSHYFGLTSIDQRMEEIGRKATQKLLARIEGKDTSAPESVLIVPDIIVRRSSNRGEK